MNTTDKLVAMANQIVANLLHEPDPAAAAAQHMQLFWDPRMKRLIYEHDGQGLTPLAAAAIDLLAKNHAAA
jgi:formate dehydrogenase subunit delta